MLLFICELYNKKILIFLTCFIFQDAAFFSDWILHHSSEIMPIEISAIYFSKDYQKLIFPTISICVKASYNKFLFYSWHATYLIVQAVVVIGFTSFISFGSFDAPRHIMCPVMGKYLNIKTWRTMMISIDNE